MSSSLRRRNPLDFLLWPIAKRDWNGRLVLRDGIAAMIVVGAIVGAVVGIVYGCMQWDMSNTRAYCSSLNGRSGMPTEFIQTSAFDWDCYAKTPGGKLVPTSQITYFVGRSK